jgi:hypothetical protein
MYLLDSLDETRDLRPQFGDGVEEALAVQR